MREVRRTVPAPDDLGNGVIGVPVGTDMELDLRLEAVMDGVLVSGTVTATAEGECVRCLDPVTERVDVDVQELFLHDPPEEQDEDNEQPLLDGDLIDLEPTVRDALVPSLPFQPVCEPDCPGLCSRCGARLKDDPDHSHEETDPRWSALSGLSDQLGGAVAQDDTPAAPSADGTRPEEEKS
ncbi:YceD family protein [Aquipuribacter sp. SD81]|uniref:YceD family protein n=1 Tax=Aquipuribacter sp. SD81 TaxID=3127703 RepID=UPI0030171C55